MSTEGQPGTFDPNSIRKVITVDASQAVAWRVFTAGMSSWWPLAHYKIWPGKRGRSRRRAVRRRPLV